MLVIQEARDDARRVVSRDSNGDEISDLVDRMPGCMLVSFTRKELDRVLLLKETAGHVLHEDASDEAFAAWLHLAAKTLGPL